MGSRGIWPTGWAFAGCVGCRGRDHRAQAVIAGRDFSGSRGRDGYRGNSRGAIAMTPAGAMLWQVCWRHRWGLIADGAYLLVAAVVIRLLPAELLQAKLNNTDVPQVAYGFSVPCLFIVLHFVAMFSVVRLIQRPREIEDPTHFCVSP